MGRAGYLQLCNCWDVEMRELPRQWSLGIQLFSGIQGYQQGRI
jgi:nitrogen fixation protein